MLTVFIFFIVLFSFLFRFFEENFGLLRFQKFRIWSELSLACHLQGEAENHNELEPHYLVPKTAGKGLLSIVMYLRKTVLVWRTNTRRHD